MPKQHVLFGRPVPRLGTRHISLLLVALSIFALLSLFFMLPNSIPTGPSLNIADHKFSIPKSFKSPWMNKLNPFRQPSHPPERQSNDTNGVSSWYSHFSWLSQPFSSSITLDENRQVLPMLQKRPKIYCYYDNTIQKDPAVRDADSELLLSWRRAWWAQGFYPVILSPAEAMNNPLYEELQRVSKDMDQALQTDIMRWLAWENMKGGLLAQWFLFPMADHSDPLLSYLRRGEFPSLTRWEELDDGLFVGPPAEITAVIKRALASPNIKMVKDLQSAIAVDRNDKTDSPFTVDKAPKSLAFYSAQVLDTQYPKIAESFRNAKNPADKATALRSLNNLVQSHLHLTWQNLFSEGISVVKPLPTHSTHLIAPAYELALRLAQCPESPLPSSCPPNRPKCTPCSTTSHPMKISTPAHYRNATNLYTIGTVPHPYTSSTLHHMRNNVNIYWIRRDSDRDAWVTDLTQDLCPKGVPSAPRVLKFKELVASEAAAARSLWLLAEEDLPEDHLDWHFGFALPSGPDASSTTYSKSRAEEPKTSEDDKTEVDTTTTSKSTTQQQTTTTTRLPPPHDPKDGPAPAQADLDREPFFLLRARAVVKADKRSAASAPANDKASQVPVATDAQKSATSVKFTPTKADVRMREALEAWNLADSEAWRFARAYLGREEVERKKFEEDEAKYADGMGSDHHHNKGRSSSSSWTERWLD